MACDRFVYFKERAPSHDDLQKILENYFGGCGSIREDRPNWWMIDLPGQATSPFEGIHGARPPRHAEDRRRWVEVVYSVRPSTTNVDVLTREQDELTNAIADQLAKALARFYGAQLDMG